MNIEILLFGVAREIAGNASLHLDIETPATVGDLLAELKIKYPELNTLSSLLIAVNQKYSEPHHIISEDDEIAVIPPVSGG